MKVGLPVVWRYTLDRLIVEELNIFQESLLDNKEITTFVL